MVIHIDISHNLLLFIIILYEVVRILLLNNYMITLKSL